MQTIHRRISRQETATWAVLAALVVVLLYSLWGASILRSQEQAQAGEGSAVVVNR